MLKGVFTALVTPFNTDGSIDEPALRDLVERQVKAGVAGLVPCGTTGESSTLSHAEHDKVVEIVCDQVKGRISVIAGTGSNSTSEAIVMTKNAKAVGATHSLQVVPYYNKPNQKGLYEHYKAIAEAVDIPIIVYNIKGRTGINLETSTLVELAKIDNIIAVKEASGSLSQMMDVIQQTPDDFSVLSGDDSLTLALVAAGGHGVISVTSNVLPEKMVAYVDAGLNNDIVTMRKHHYELLEMMKKLFIDTNPIPVKTLLALKDRMKLKFRLPLCEPSDEVKEVLTGLIKTYNI